MQYKLLKYNSLINKITSNDSLFIGRYTVDPYQNCDLGCRYCDSTFENTVYIKSNAVELLEKEINNIEKGVVIVGSVSDAYQKIEEKQMLTRHILEILYQYDIPVHILTKSDIILRDLDVLTKFNKSLVTISISSLKDNLLNKLENKVPSGNKRLEVMQEISQHGIKTGIAVIPVLPYLVEDELDEIIRKASEHNANYVLHKCLELKGNQKTIYFNILKNNYPYLLDKYMELYRNSYRPNENYITMIKDTFFKLCNKYSIKNKIL